MLSPSYRLKSCVDAGGANADIAFSGAPHSPGIIYTANVSGIIAKNRRVTVSDSNFVSLLKRINPSRYSPVSSDITIHSDINVSRGRIPHPYAKSATDRNFSANANSTNASTTFTEFNHPPDFGSCFIAVGNRANRANGIANARAKANIPTAGPTVTPDVAASTSKNPIIGPVHENDTRARVNAINSIAMNPVVESAFASSFVVHFAGSSRLNAPKNDAANSTSSRAKNILKKALVDKSFSALAPNSVVINSPSVRYIIIIANPNSRACVTAFRRVPLCFIKKLTVIGIIGHTHGVARANKPPIKPAINIYQRV